MCIKVGNIVTSYKPTDFDICFNVVTSVGEVDSSLPTLIVGIEEAKPHFENFSHSKRYNANKTFFWTYKKTESRSDFIKDVEQFTNHCVENSVKNIRYEYVDITTYSYTRLKKFINFIDSDTKKTFFFTKNNNFVFFYAEKTNYVFGLSLNLLEYFGIKKEKVVTRILKNHKNLIFKEYNKKNGKILSLLHDSEYLAPFLLSL